jgi:hypothetical protein
MGIAEIAPRPAQQHLHLHPHPHPHLLSCRNGPASLYSDCEKSPRASIPASLWDLLIEVRVGREGIQMLRRSVLSFARRSLSTMASQPSMEDTMRVKVFVLDLFKYF